MSVTQEYRFGRVVEEICELNWSGLTRDEMTLATWAYYYFSIQFRENLQIARSLYPDDEKLRVLEREECDTANLSPWPGVASPGERINHDEFMRRTLATLPIDKESAARLTAIGQDYLDMVRKLDPVSRALSIASYEDGGLEKVFGAILEFQDWDDALLLAFKHFLVEHIRFDSDPEQGHGALSRHMAPDDRVLPLWEGFRDIFVMCVPKLLPVGSRQTYSAAYQALPMQ